MAELGEKFREFRSSADPEAVPWEKAVVWVSRDGAGGRLYEWICAEEIRQVSWVSGLVSIMPEGSSFLAKRFQCITLPSALTFIGAGVKTGN